MAAHTLAAIGISSAAVDALRLLHLYQSGEVDRFWFQAAWLVAFGVAGAASMWRPPAALASGGGTGAYLVWALVDGGPQCAMSICL